MNRIIYKNEDESIAVIIPTNEVLKVLSLEQIAEKDVPSNLPYWLVNDTDIPSDRTDRDRWKFDGTEGDADGFGGDSNEFTDAQLLELYNAGVIK